MASHAVLSFVAAPQQADYRGGAKAYEAEQSDDNAKHHALATERDYSQGKGAAPQAATRVAAMHMLL